LKAGGSVILPCALAAGGLALAEACAADHLVLRRVIAKAALDGVARPLDLVPQGSKLGVAQGALVGELCLEGSDLGFDRARSRQRAEGGDRRDLVPAVYQ